MKIVSYKWFVAVTLTLILTGCFDDKSVSHITFRTSYAGVPLDCNTGVSQVGKSWSYHQFQFYLSEVSIKTQDGSWQPWEMTTTSYQSNDVALLGEVCGENNQTTNNANNANWQVSFKTAENLAKVSAIKFTLGIPFELNHLNPLTQPSPLNDSSMFWVWQTGHKFLRLEMASQTDNWLFHLGSTGCTAPSAVRAPKQACLYPNTATVVVPMNKMSNSNNQISFDIAKLIQGLTIENKASCQSDVNNQACQLLFNNIGVTKSSENTGVFVND